LIEWGAWQGGGAIIINETTMQSANTINAQIARRRAQV